MKKYALLILIALFSSLLLSQTAPISSLTTEESTHLNSLLEEERGDFDFEGKKVAFVTGSSGQSIISKKYCFQLFILPHLEDDQELEVSMDVLTEDEKASSGGYDVIVLVRVKTFTESRKKQIVSRLRILES
jgi:hypothetical protein